MFISDDILEFLTKIIEQNNKDNLKETIENIGIFRDYLRLTKMADECTIQRIDRIMNCVPEIMALKEKIGDIDLASIVASIEPQNGIGVKTSNKKKQLQYEDKHYRHYSSPSSSSGCGSSSSSYSSSCGGTVSRTSRC